MRNDYTGIDIKSGNLIIDAGPWGDAVGYKVKLSILQKCIESCNLLSITYHDRNGDITERVIEPHVIVFKQGLWYVFAYCHLRNEFRFFKTGRIHSANLLKTTFVRQNIDKVDVPLDYWNTTKEVFNVKLIVNKTVLSDVEEWLGIENVELVNGEYYANIKLPIDNGLISKILGFGDGVKVIEPKFLKEKIIEIIPEDIFLQQTCHHFGTWSCDRRRQRHHGSF